MMKPSETNLARETRFAKSLYGDLPKPILHALKELIQRHQILLTNGDVKYLDGGWTLPIPVCFDSPSDAIVPESIAGQSWNPAILSRLGGYSELRLSSAARVRDS
jgi:hypothetical protein